MKPKNKEQRALLLRDSMRGGFIISQALLLAIESIESRPKMEQEPSNVADMQLLLDELFPMYKPVHEINTAGKLLQDFENGVCIHCGEDDVECLDDCSKHKCVACGTENE